MRLSKSICFVATDALSFNVLYSDQLEYLVGKGFKLTLVCGGSDDELNALRSRDVGEVFDVKLVRAPSPWADTLSLLRLVWHFIFHKYDVVVVTTPKALLLGSISAAITMQRRRVAFFQGRVYENYTGLIRRIYRTFDRLTIYCVHEVLFVSRSLRSEFVTEIPAAKDKGRVLGDGSVNGVCSRTFSLEAASSHAVSIRNELNISSDSFVLLSVGRIGRDKGLGEIARIAERFSGSDVKIVLLGQPEGYDAEDELRRLVSTGLVKHVPFSRHVAHYFAIADVHLFLSHREGFGNVAVEAAAMCVPTIAFDVIGVRDSVNSGVSGVRVAFGDLESVVAAINEFIDPALCPASALMGPNRLN